MKRRELLIVGGLAVAALMPATASLAEEQAVILEITGMT